MGGGERRRRAQRRGLSGSLINGGLRGLSCLFRALVLLQLHTKPALTCLPRKHSTARPRSACRPGPGKALLFLQAWDPNHPERGCRAKPGETVQDGEELAASHLSGPERQVGTSAWCPQPAPRSSFLLLKPWEGAQTLLTCPCGSETPGTPLCLLI